MACLCTSILAVSTLASDICLDIVMSKTRIFVSSTCYDLGAVREILRKYISQLDHEPILSEYPSELDPKI